MGQALPSNTSVTAFCGVPLVSGDLPPGTTAAVLGAGSSLGSAHDGSENGPFFLRTLSKAHTWAAADPGVFTLRHGRNALDGIADLGDLDFTGMDLPQALDTIADAVRALPRDVVPCVLGGDHSITLPVVQVLAERRTKPFTVVQFDHHLDLQIWEGAPGDPRAEREPVFNTNVMSHVSDLVGPGRLVQVGVSPFATVEARSLDAMRTFLAATGRQLCLTDPELHDPALFRAAIGQGHDIYLSLDIDVLQRAEMSSTGYPAEIGLSTHTLLRLIDLVLDGNRLIGFDLVEFAADRSDRSDGTLSDAGRATAVFLHVLSWISRQAGEQSEKRSETCQAH